MPRQLIFISHSHVDSGNVSILSKWIDANLLGAIDFFISTDSKSLPLGSEWYRDISKALEYASLAIIVVSPRSLLSGWIYFEAGAAKIRGIPVVPICIGDVEISELPSPLNQFQATKVTTKSEQKNLLSLIANYAGLRCPKKISSLALSKAPAVSYRFFDWPHYGLLGVSSHAEAITDFISRLQDISLPTKNIYISGASVSDIIHSSTLSIAKAATNINCETISIIIKRPDLEWSEKTALGMCFIPPYTPQDSLKMLEQTRNDILKLKSLCNTGTCRFTAYETDWPPSYTFGAIVYDDSAWGFLEPFCYGIPVSERVCFLLFQNDPLKHLILQRLILSHNNLIANSKEI